MCGACERIVVAAVRVQPPAVVDIDDGGRLNEMSPASRISAIDEICGSVAVFTRTAVWPVSGASLVFWTCTVSVRCEPAAILKPTPDGNVYVCPPNSDV